MSRVKINNAEYEFAPGTRILEACRSVGHYIPHFCYHPTLSVVGSCRMCKVEILHNNRRWIDISCKAEVAEGMEIFTSTDAVKKQQQMTLEYLLANHPLDCPICDDAGECDLQDFYLKYGKHDSRQREPKIRKHKATDIGKTIVLDSERCVLCSRCVRFTQEITKTHELGIFGMGSTEELMVRPGTRLDNDYSGNVVDLCPVGALTDKDFRFKRRVWYLRMTPSICQLCSRGCNVRIDADLNPFHSHKKFQLMRTHRTPTTTFQRIQRLKPRPNDAVNSYWICDTGRYGYKPTDANDRLSEPIILDDDGNHISASISDTVKYISNGINSALKGGAHKIAVIVSPLVTNEEAFAVWSLFRNKLNLPNIDHRIPGRTDWYSDDLLRTPDPFPNRAGCEWIKLLPDANGVNVESLNEAVMNGKIDTLICVLTTPSEFLNEEALKKLKRSYLIVRNLSDQPPAWVSAALPATAWGEYRGTFTNFQGRIQRLEAAFEPLGMAKPVWHWMNELGSALKKPLNFTDPNDIWRSIGDQLPTLKGITLETISPVGFIINTTTLKAVG